MSGSTHVGDTFVRLMENLRIAVASRLTDPEIVAVAMTRMDVGDVEWAAFVRRQSGNHPLTPESRSVRKAVRRNESSGG